MREAVRRGFQITLTVGLIVFATGPGGLAGQTTTTDLLKLTLSLVTPVPSCAATVDAVDFGSLDAGSSITSAQGSQFFNINLNCSTAVAAGTAQFDVGQNPSPSPVQPARRMTEAGGATVNYTLRDETAGLIIGIGSNDVISFAAPTGSSTLPLRASFGTQTLPTAIGAYNDQVTVTFTF